MRSLYVVGGQQRSPRSLLENDQSWYEYGQGIMLRVDLETGQVERCLEYVSPLTSRAEDDPVLFKCGTLMDDTCYLSTQTEVLIYRLPAFEQIGYVSLPCFNDIHHVLPTPKGNLLVANSGLEMVLELTPDGEVLREWNVLGIDPWQGFSKDVDYRKGVNLKPHLAHPNYVFYLDGELWVTRFEQRDAVSLTQPGRCIHIGIERVHDGVYQDGRIFFTTVNGNLVIVNSANLEIEQVLDLTEMHDADTLLGWCRGLLFDDDNVWIGFSRIRPTKFREAVSWVRNGFSRALPTHIARYDLKRQVCLDEIDLEEHGMNAVFSIFPAS